MVGGSDDHHHTAAATASAKETPRPSTLRLVFLDSIKIFLFNLKLFASIFLLFGLPLSFLLFSLSASTATLRLRVFHLESLAAIISVRIEALNILEESLLFLSTFLLISAASATASPLLHRCRFGFLDITPAVRSSWWRGLLTGVVAHLSISGFGQLTRTAAVATAAVCGPAAGSALGLVSAVAEVYITVVFAVGTVASVMEDRFGLDAFRTGWGLMSRRRTAGFAVTAVTGAIVVLRFS